MVVTAPVSQLVMSASKSVVPPPPMNISFMLVTAAVFHLLPSVLMAWLNLELPSLPLNMKLMSVTAFVSQSLMSWLNSSAALNMLAMLVTAPVSQLVMSALNLSAPLNMFAMVVTAAVFHLLPSVLRANFVVHPNTERQRWNLFAFWNMELMSVTLAVSQLEMSWLKTLAPLNMPSILVTADVSHLDISMLNFVLSLKSSVISVTRLTSQSGISVVPATPQSAPLLQQSTPELGFPISPDPGTVDRQLSTADFRAARFANFLFAGAGVGIGVGVPP